MLSREQFHEMSLSLPGTEEKIHFDRLAYKVKGKRIFATYLAADHTANLFLTPAEQREFCSLDSVNIYPLPNKWGLKGVTTFVLANLEREIVMEALLSAYHDILKPK